MSAVQSKIAHTLPNQHKVKADQFHKPGSRHTLFWQSLLIALPFVTLVALTIYSQFTANNTLAHFLEILCAVILLLLIIHSLITASENARLIHEQEEHSAKAELLHKATASLGSILEMEQLLDHIVTIGARELGFDTIAVVLIEEYESPLDEYSSIQARAATTSTLQVAAWHLSGKRLTDCLALLGEKLEVLWHNAPAYLPTPVHQWHLDQRVQASRFVPLVYQGKIQGCLAFSLSIARPFTSQESELAHAFTEEAANALEHAHLFELARENALFSQAMSNVAARLNSVVATGMGMGSEIHQLICTEGANALSADLAILYVYSPGGHFIPQAAITGLPEPPTLLQEWPIILPEVYTSFFLDSHQPFLFQVDHQGQIGAKHSIYTAWPGALTPHTPEVPSLPTLDSRSHPLPPMLRPTRISLVPFSHPHTIPSPEQCVTTLHDVLRRRSVHTAILAPLIIHQHPMGLLVLARVHRSDTPQKRAFAPQDLSHAQDFAGQASIAFINARLYQQLRNAHHRMKELDQLKDQFIMTASHELRTPLTAVQGYLELLEQYHSSLSTEQHQEFLQKASRGCEELVLLLNNVMDASRLEVEAGIRPAHLERTSVREVVEHVIDLIVLQATQEHRHIQLDIPAHLMVKADPTHLRQVVLNLSANALKYSPPGTPLTFSARAFLQRNSSVVISVTDRGKGIKPHDQARLFQRFTRLESDLNSTVRGSGLGLYISRRLVEAMHGRIWIESTGVPGTGTTFHIQLPLA